MAAVRPASAMRELRTDATDPRTRGEQAGAALREQIAAVEQAYRRLFAALRGWGEDDVARFGEQVLARVGRWRPSLVAELEGARRRCGPSGRADRRAERPHRGRPACTSAA